MPAGGLGQTTASRQDIAYPYRLPTPGTFIICLSLILEVISDPLYTAQSIRRVHLELTERCNAACPLCLRTNPDGLSTHPYIQNAELLLDDIQRIFHETFKIQLVAVHLCGNYGDPIVARDCLEIADYFCNEKCAVSLKEHWKIKRPAICLRKCGQRDLPRKDKQKISSSDIQ